MLDTFLSQIPIVGLLGYTWYVQSKHSDQQDEKLKRHDEEIGLLRENSAKLSTIIEMMTKGYALRSA